MMNRTAFQAVLLRLFKFAAVPLVLYFVAFCLLTRARVSEANDGGPLITQFRTHLYAANGDGYQNVWNIWWVNRAVLQLHQSPWDTDHLRHPKGVPLLGHTLTAFNGFVSIPLLRVLTPEQAYNFMVVFGFVTTGWAMFLLAYRLTWAYVPSLVAGYIYTFCNYHFAHAEGHLNFVSMEWIPIFVLLWYLLMVEPGIWIGIGAGLALFFVLICEYNYYFYCVLMAPIIFIWNAIRLKQPLFFTRKQHLLPLTAFGLTVLLTSGPIVFPLMRLNAGDALHGHEPSLNSMDLLAPFIHGGHWYFAELTKPYWSKVMDGNIHESSVHLGWSVWLLLGYACWRRRDLGLEAFGLWLFVLLFFFILALGPTLRVWGKIVPGTENRLAYHWLEYIVPGMRVSGVPVRMAMMVAFAAAIISAGAIKHLWAVGGWRRLAIVGLLAVLALEYLPTPVPAIKPRMPGYVGVLRDLPPGGVLDAGEFTYPQIAQMTGEKLRWDMYGWTPSMYHQTFHRKPIAFGFLPRQPSSVVSQDVQIASALIGEQFSTLRDKYDIRYLVISDVSPRVLKSPFVKVLYKEGNTALLALEQPTLREVPVPIEPLATHQLKRLNGSWQSEGDDPRLVLALSKPGYVNAVRIRIRYADGDLPARFQIFWRNGAQDFSETARSRTVEVPRGADETVTIIVEDTIDQIRIDPDDRPGVFRIAEVTLLEF